MKKRAARTTKKRECLKCGIKFDSTGPGNRICPKCARKNVKINCPHRYRSTINESQVSED